MIMSRFLEYEVEALISIAAVLHPARSFYDTKGWSALTPMDRGNDETVVSGG